MRQTPHNVSQAAGRTRSWIPTTAQTVPQRCLQLPHTRQALTKRKWPPYGSRYITKHKATMTDTTGADLEVGQGAHE